LSPRPSPESALPSDLLSGSEKGALAKSS
jgi:hypothetical protein